MIEHEFQFLYNPQEGIDTLAKFRTAMGGKKAFPAIHEFVATIQRKAEAEGPAAKHPVA